MWFWVLGWFFCILTMIVNRFVIFLVRNQRQLRTKTTHLSFLKWWLILVLGCSLFLRAFSATLRPNARFETFERIDFNLRQNLL